MEIKRYDLCFDQYPSEDGTRTIRTPSYIGPHSDGDYVLYADHLQILEAIGAGGVSGRITQKSIEQHRAEFMAQWPHIHSHGLDGGWKDIAWAAWKAARGLTV